MKPKHLLPALFILSSFYSFAQKTNFAYAITGQSTGNFNWTDIRMIDLSNGAASKTIFESGKTKFDFASSKIDKKINPNNTTVSNLPTQSMVAAAAYDKRHNKLFFTPMKVGELRWLDLSAKGDYTKFYTIQSEPLIKADLNNEANQITRMTIASDGNGYAISNDGNHLLCFTTGKKTVITDLGNLTDASSNNGLSIHNKSSWGGDVVADVHGNLYLFSAPQSVFKINIKTRVSNYLGNIKNLSTSFTVNGAAVDNDGNVIVSSANTFEGFYKFNIKDLSATKLNTTGQVFNASDLANGNLLFENDVRNEVGVATLPQIEVIRNQNISVYPNPVSGAQFKVTFDNTKAGNYEVALSDIQGKLITYKKVNIQLAKQVETMQMKLKPAGGIYMIKVTDADKKSIFVDKIVID